MDKNIFFSKNRKSALRHIKKLCKKDKFYCDRKVKLAKKQVTHRSGWKTWKHIKRK